MGTKIKFCRHTFSVMNGSDQSRKNLKWRALSAHVGWKFLAMIGFFNPKESENVFCVSLLDRSIQGLSDHGASKEPKTPLWKWILWFL